MAPVRGNFGQRFEDETPFVQSGVRQDQIRKVEYQVVEPEQVEIEGAWALGDRGWGSVASHCEFDRLEGVEKGDGLERGFEQDRGVEESGLVCIEDGGCIEEGRDRRYRAERAQMLDRKGQVLFASAPRRREVGTEGDCRTMKRRGGFRHGLQ